MKIIDYFCVFFGGRLLGKPRLTFASSWKILARMEKRIFSHDGCSTAKIFPELAQVTSPVKGHSVKRMYVCMYVLIITGVQASGVIIDRLLRQCCFVWSEIVGPHNLL